MQTWLNNTLNFIYTHLQYIKVQLDSNKYILQKLYHLLMLHHTLHICLRFCFLTIQKQLIGYATVLGGGPVRAFKKRILCMEQS